MATRQSVLENDLEEEVEVEYYSQCNTTMQVTVCTIFSQ